MAVEAAGIDLDRETAGFGQRAAAAVIDTLVLFALTTPLVLPWLEQLMSAVMAADVDLFFDLLLEYDLAWWPLAGACTVVFGYAVFMLGRYGRTLGMMVFGLRVTNLDGTHIGWGKAALRTAAYVVPDVAAAVLYDQNELAWSLVSGLRIIGLLWIMVDGAHQGYHDKIARTLVMRKRLRSLRSDGTPGP
jgi:uncharacterized RDD family membrane protein YckC